MLTLHLPEPGLLRGDDAQQVRIYLEKFYVLL